MKALNNTLNYRLQSAASLTLSAPYQPKKWPAKMPATIGFVYRLF